MSNFTPSYLCVCVFVLSALQLFNSFFIGLKILFMHIHQIISYCFASKYIAWYELIIMFSLRKSLFVHCWYFLSLTLFNTRCDTRQWHDFQKRSNATNDKQHWPVLVLLCVCIFKFSYFCRNFEAAFLWHTELRHSPARLNQGTVIHTCFFDMCKIRLRILIWIIQ